MVSSVGSQSGARRSYHDRLGRSAEWSIATRTDATSTCSARRGVRRPPARTAAGRFLARPYSKPGSLSRTAPPCTTAFRRDEVSSFEIEPTDALGTDEKKKTSERMPGGPPCYGCRLPVRLQINLGV